jgi:hypothetical protein
MEALDGATGAGRETMLDLSGVGVVQSIDQTAANGVRVDVSRDGAGKRARWIPCARYVMNEDEALQTISKNGLDVDREVLLEVIEIEATELECLHPSAEGTVRLLEEQPGRMVFGSQSSEDGWFLLSETWFPGWRAFVDGNEALVFRGDYLFQAIFLSPGEHIVEFRYQPNSWSHGLMISLASFLLWSALFILAWRERRRRTVANPPGFTESAEVVAE